MDFSKLSRSEWLGLVASALLGLGLGGMVVRRLRRF